MKVDYVTFSNLIIDDIVFPDGQTFMNTLGGAGMHALVGMHVWNNYLGYSASVGTDLDPHHRESLERFDVDLQGLVVRKNHKTARAWQVFEPDERRIEIFRTSLDDFERHKITMDELPTIYRSAKGFHLQWGTLAELEELILSLRDTKPDIVLVLESTTENLEEHPAEYRRVLSHLSLFSPDLGEGQMITGATEPDEICDTLIDWGASLIALRMGERGSLVQESSGERYLVPAVPARIVDVTGAGNSYCGGFLTGLGDGLTSVESSLRATVSASFALEQFGLPDWHSAPVDEAKRRLAWARERVKPLSKL